MTDCLKLLVVDDHTLFVDAIKHELVKLAEEVEILDANNCVTALEIAEAHRDLNLILLDLNMPGMPGLEALKIFVERFPLLPVVALTASDDVSDMQYFIDEGAMGYIHKSTPGKVMLSAINLVLAGGVYIPRELVRRNDSRVASVNIPQSEKEQAQQLGFTPRQFDVFCYMLGGHANKVIGRALDMSENTVKVHVTTIMKVLGVEKRAQVPMALEKLGWDIRKLAR